MKNKKQSPYVITKSDSLNVIIEESPRAAELLVEYGIQCAGCLFGENDALLTRAQLHGMREDEVEEMIEEINGELEKEWKRK